MVITMTSASSSCSTGTCLARWRYIRQLELIGVTGSICHSICHHQDVVVFLRKSDK